MNRITTEILTEFLSTEEAWDHKTRELRYQSVLNYLHGRREQRYYNEVFFPRMMRAYRLMRSWGMYPPEAFEEVDMGYDEEIHGYWPIDPDLADELSTRFCGEVWYTNTGKMRSTYFGNKWYNGEWVWEEPSKEEILALGVTPKMVPDKVDKAGNVQSSMF